MQLSMSCLKGVGGGRGGGEPCIEVGTFIVIASPWWQTLNKSLALE